MSDTVTSRLKHEMHAEKIERKYQTVAGKRAILTMWESGEYGEPDHDYLIKLRARVRSLEQGLVHMRPGEDERF